MENKRPLQVEIIDTLRVNKFELILEEVDLSINQVKATCPVHGVWYFTRLEGTKRFICAHSDHLGRSANGADGRLDFVKQR